MPSQLNITTEVGKVSPPALVTALHAGGMTPADWITVLTLLYLALQIGLLLPRYLEKFREWRQGRNDQ